MVAAKLANIKNSDFAGNQHSANLQTPQVSRAEAAKMLNVSERTVNAGTLQGIGFFVPEILASVAAMFSSLNLHARVSALMKCGYKLVTFYKTPEIKKGCKYATL
jgi:hypothetical protein